MSQAIFYNKTQLKTKDVRFLVCIGVFLFSAVLSAQEITNKQKAKKVSQYIQKAQAALGENNFPLAEANYRKVIALDPENAKAKYNIGTLYYTKDKAQEAASKLHEAGKVAENKSLKHRAYHNQGNAFMKQKNYKAAIEAYKNALRNDPTDDETRYNLAVAKQKQAEKEKKQQNQKDSPKNKKDKKDDNKGDKNKKKDQKDGGKKSKDNQKKGDDQKDKKGDQNQKNKQNKDPQNQQKDQKNKSPKKGENKQKQSTNGGMSKQQVRNLLEAMKNQEKQVQKKINAAKSKGKRVKNAKDW